MNHNDEISIVYAEHHKVDILWRGWVSCPHFLPPGIAHTISAKRYGRAKLVMSCVCGMTFTCGITLNKVRVLQEDIVAI